MFFSDGGKKPARAPREYIDMLILPRQGIAYKPTYKLSTIERYIMDLMLTVESEIPTGSG